MHTLHVDQKRQRIIDSTGRRFFYLADTAWELLHRLSMDEAALYLQTRGSATIQRDSNCRAGGVADLGRQGQRRLGHGAPVVFTEANARQYGRWFGTRYRNASIIWVNSSV